MSADWQVTAAPYRDDRFQVSIERGQFVTGFDVTRAEAEGVIEALRDVLTGSVLSSSASGFLSSPPADDVREALIDAMVNVEVTNGMVEFADDEDDRRDAGHLADAILSDPRFEVRLRGTVTEPTEVKRAETSAGFAIWRIPNADYTGQPVRTITVQESSLATEFRVWLGYDDERRMHLTADAAREVREALTAWLREFGLDGEARS